MVKYNHKEVKYGLVLPDSVNVLYGVMQRSTDVRRRTHMRVFLLRVWNILGWEWDGWIDSLLLCCVWHMCWPRPPRLAGRGLTRTGILEHCILKSTHCTVYQCAVESCVSHWIKNIFFAHNSDLFYLSQNYVLKS